MAMNALLIINLNIWKYNPNQQNDKWILEMITNQTHRTKTFQNIIWNNITYNKILTKILKIEE